MLRLIKSNTFKSGTMSIIVLMVLQMYRVPISSILDEIYYKGTGEIVFSIIFNIIAIIGILVIGKGRLDADTKPPLRFR